MHDEIIRYSMSGVITDGNLVTTKERMVRFLETQMRDNGCTPRLELEPEFDWSYNREDDTWAFEISVYGSFVGREAAWQTAGMMNGTTITNSTQRPRSKESSDTAE